MFSVLIVDDEPYIRKGLQILIDWERYGFCIKGEASNGIQAMELLEEDTYDLIISDIKMPKMNGLELMEYTWRNISSNMKFILLSGYYEFEYAKQAIKYEAANYLLKPVERDELVTAINLVKEQLLASNTYKDGFQASTTYHIDKKMLDQIIIDVEEQNTEDLERKVGELYYYFKYVVRKKEFIQLHLDYMLISFIDLLKKIVNDYKPEAVDDMVNRIQFHQISSNLSNESLMNFIMELSKYINRVRQDSLGGVLTEIQKEISKNYMEALSLKILSEKYYMNSAYLGQLFKKQYGVSFKDYLNRYRMERAAELLRRTDIMIYEISESVGFHSTDYFISKFVEIYQVTPLQYRKQMLNSKH